MTWRIYSIIVLLPIVAMTVVATVRPLQWISLVPDPMATHFDAAGNPNGFTSPVSNIAMISTINVVIIIAVALGLRFRYLTGSNGRILSGTAVFTVVLLSVIQLNLFKIQARLTDAADAYFPLSGVGLAFGFAAIAGVGIAWVPPPAAEKKPEVTAWSTNVLTEPDDDEWRSVETLHPGVQVFLGLTFIGMVSLTLISPGWVSILTAVIVVVLLFATWGWRLRIDAEGFSYSGFLGFPRAVIPHGSITAVDVKDIRPGEWGGWGWRISGAGTGLITRAGSGLRITRTNGRILEISTRDAVAAANLLNYYGQRDSAHHQSEF